MHRSLLILALLLTAGCAQTAGHPHAGRQWREGDMVHYDDGNQYQIAVSTALPHYRIGPAGAPVPTDEPSAAHYHLLINPKGPPNQYVRCFARRLPDGSWEHAPQWHENDPKWKLRHRDYGY